MKPTITFATAAGQIAIAVLSGSNPTTAINSALTSLLANPATLPALGATLTGALSTLDTALLSVPGGRSQRRLRRPRSLPQPQWSRHPRRRHVRWMRSLRRCETGSAPLRKPTGPPRT